MCRKILQELREGERTWGLPAGRQEVDLAYFIFFGVVDVVLTVLCPAVRTFVSLSTTVANEHGLKELRFVCIALGFVIMKLLICFSPHTLLLYKQIPYLYGPMKDCLTSPKKAYPDTRILLWDVSLPSQDYQNIASVHETRSTTISSHGS